MKKWNNKVILNSYSFHTFPFYGYYFAWALGSYFDVILLVEQGNENSPTIKSLIKNKRVSELVLMPCRHHHFQLHKFTAKKLKSVISKHRPFALFQANFHYYHQKHISNIVAKISPETKQIVFQGSQLLINIPLSDSSRELMEARITGIAKKLPGPIKGAARFLHSLKGLLSNFRDYWFYPIILTGRKLDKTYDPYRAKIIKGVPNNLHAILTYSEQEKKAYTYEVNNHDIIKIVRHPMLTDASASRSLYDQHKSFNQIAVLPSRCVKYEIGIDNAQEVNRVGNLWLMALLALLSKEKGASIIWKLHPDFHGEPIMEGVTDYLKNRLKNFTVLEPWSSAQTMILGSKVVVGDVSSVLLWASRLGECDVYSLDLFDVQGGDEMRYYPNIHVVNNLEDLRVDQNKIEEKLRYDTSNQDVVDYLIDLVNEKNSNLKRV